MDLHHDCFFPEVTKRYLIAYINIFYINVSDPPCSVFGLEGTGKTACVAERLPYHAEVPGSISGSREIIVYPTIKSLVSFGGNLWFSIVCQWNPRYRVTPVRYEWLSFLLLFILRECHRFLVVRVFFSASGTALVFVIFTTLWVRPVRVKKFYLIFLVNSWIYFCI